MSVSLRRKVGLAVLVAALLVAAYQQLNGGGLVSVERSAPSTVVESSGSSFTSTVTSTESVTVHWRMIRWLLVVGFLGGAIALWPDRSAGQP